MKERRRYLLDRDGVLAPLMLLPSVVYILALVAVPFFLAIAYSLSDVTVGDPSFDYVGLRNFRAVLKDPVFRRSLTNSLFITAVTMVLVLVLGKILALVLTRDFRFKWVVRFLILLPWTTPVPLAAIAWLWMLDSVYSPIDWVLRSLGFIESNVYWLGKDTLAMASVIAVHTWRIVPLAAVIILAGLISIPDDIKDAAKVDGAGFWRTLWEITLPLTLPVIAVAIRSSCASVASRGSAVHNFKRPTSADASRCASIQPTPRPCSRRSRTNSTTSA